MNDRIEFYHGRDAIANTTAIMTCPHGLFEGWFHGMLLDSRNVILARTEQAFPSKFDALKAISSVLVNNTVHV